jgi:hypothetical protein
VHVAGNGAGIGGIDEELVDLEPAVALGGDGNAEDRQCLLVEVAGIGDVAGAQVHVIDQAAGVKLH